MGRIKARQRLAQAEREKAIGMAIEAVQHPHWEATKRLSVCAAAEIHGIEYSTLKDRLKGAVSRMEAHFQPQLLTPTDGKAVVRLIDTLERTGFPPRIQHLRQAAESITRCTPGQN